MPGYFLRQSFRVKVAFTLIFILLYSNNANAFVENEDLKKIVKDSTEDLIEAATFQGNKFKEKLSLKGGFGFINRAVHAQRGTKDNFRAGGFNTQFGYAHSKRYEINIASYIYFGKTKNLIFEVS